MTPEIHEPLAKFSGRKYGDLELPARTVLKLSMMNLCGYGTDCVAYAVFGRRLMPGEFPVLMAKLKDSKHRMQFGADDVDELDAIDAACREFSKERGIPYCLAADLVSADIQF